MPLICPICGFVYFDYLGACPNCVKEEVMNEKPEEQWTALDYWDDLNVDDFDLEPETYVRAGKELAGYAVALETANADLLEALKDILKILGRIPEDDPHETWGNVNASIQEAHDITDDTIRKHKGEGK